MKKIINQLFLRMSSIYGKKWTSSFASPEVENFAKREWYEAVVSKGLTPDQIREAVDHCRDHLEWPPTIKEFLTLGKPARNPMHVEFKNQLPPPDLPPEKVQENLAKLRSILSSGDVLKDPYN